LYVHHAGLFTLVIAYLNIIDGLDGVEEDMKR
jgi:hypothetical protein